MLDTTVIAFDREDDHRRLRRALGCFATGVTVVTTQFAGELKGLTVNSFASVSLDPPLVLWSLAHYSPSFAAFRDSGSFAVNVLADGHSDLSRHFARPSDDKFVGVRYTQGQGGCPCLDEALAVFECETETRLAQGDHTVFIGRVIRARYRGGEPLIFSNGGYYGRKELADVD